jgi:hypothetical protein
LSKVLLFVRRFMYQYSLNAFPCIIAALDCVQVRPAARASQWQREAIVTDHARIKHDLVDDHQTHDGMCVASSR